MKKRGTVTASVAMALGAALSLVAVSPATYAATAATGTTGPFSMQLTPSPLVETVKPGVETTAPITIRNNGVSTEALKVEIRHFTFNSSDGSISIADTPATDYSKWVTFASPTFNVQPGSTFTENVKFDFPSNSGFSYSFVIIFSRQSQPQATGGGRLLQGSIADFGLVNIDRPGASKALQLTSVKASAGVYEYVPATLTITMKNSGNTIIQPLGNIFIGRGNVNKPIDTLPFNANQSYILPNTTRSMSATWNDGFPRIETTTDSNGKTTSHTVWNWGDISKFRVGEYTAKVVAVYNNGKYDVPLNATATFWIIPWKILLVALLIILIFAFGIFMIIRSVVKSARSRRSGGFRL